ncbi:MAG: outer membrane protein assembly factor BamE [Bacteroidota bacterium]
MNTFRLVYATSIITPRTITKSMRNVLLLAALTTLLSGCLSVYHLEVQQGNVVTQEMVDKLKPGMTRNQVRYVLGTPLVIDPFHPDRWDYYYYLRGSKEKTGEAQRVTVIFRNDLLATVEGGVRIKNSDTPSEATGNKTPAAGAIPEPSPSRLL